MKIKSRKQLLVEYKEECSHIPLDDFERMGWFIKSIPDNKRAKVLEKAKERAQVIIKQRKMNTIQITLCEYPMKTDRGRHLGNRVWSPNAAANKKYLADCIRSIKKEIKLINTPASLDCTAFLKMPTTIKPHEQILYEIRLLRIITKPDSDNITKCYSDMMSEVITIDDDIFYDMRCRKYYSWLPRIVLKIKYQNCHESEYLYNKIKKRDIVKTLEKDGLIDIKLI